MLYAKRILATSRGKASNTMRKIALLFSLLSLVLPVLADDEKHKDEEKPFVVASVDHILITRLDVERFLKIFKSEYFRLEGSYLQIEKERAQSLFSSALHSLIVETLLINYAARQNWIETGKLDLSVQTSDSELVAKPKEDYEKQLPFRLKAEDEKLVQKSLEEQARRFGSLQNYAEILESAGLSIDYIKDRIRISILEERLHKEKLVYDKNVAPSEIAQFYKENVSEFCQPDSLLLREIVIRFKRNNRRALKAAEEKSVQVKEALASGEKFEDVVKKFSESTTKEDEGLWDNPVKITSLSEQIRNAVKELKEGEYTKEPVLLEYENSDEAEFGFFKVEKRIQGEHKTLESVCEQIKARILNNRRMSALDEFLANLVRSAKITIYEKSISLKSLFPSLP